MSPIVFAQNLISFKDSIRDLSVFDLDDLTVDFEVAQDTLRANFVANHLIDIATKKDEYDYVARAYFTKSTLEKSLEIRTKYVDSMMFFAKLSNLDYLLSDVYFQKGEVSYLKGNYEESMENLAVAYGYSLIDGNIEQQLLVETYMSTIKNILARYYEANEILKGSYNYYDKTRFKDLDNKEAFLAVIYNLTLSNIYIERPDSTLYFVQKGRVCLKDMSHTKYENLFTRSEAIANLYLSNYERSLMLLEESLIGLSKHDLAHSYYYMAESFNGLGKDDMAIEYFIKADSILEKSGSRPFEDMILAYKKLYRHFQIIEEPNKSEIYLNKLFLLDSSLTAKKQSVSEKLHTLYSLPRVKVAQQRIIKKKKLNRIVIVALSLAIIMAVFIIVFQRKKLTKQKLNANNIIQQETKGIFQPIFSDKPSTKSLDDNVYHSILAGLREFEAKEGFLDSKVNINNLSKDLGTNTTYLSKFMNERMGIGFPNYLKALRINYAVNMLKENPQLLKYSMNGLASEFGFNSADTFSRTFKEVAKTSPSIFIKELIRNKNTSDNFYINAGISPNL